MQFTHTFEGTFLVYDVPVNFHRQPLEGHPISGGKAALCVPWPPLPARFHGPRPTASAGRQPLSNPPALHFSSVFPQQTPASCTTISSSLNSFPLPHFANPIPPFLNDLPSCSLTNTIGWEPLKTRVQVY